MFFSLAALSLLGVLSCNAKLNNNTLDDSNSAIVYSAGWNISVDMNGMNLGGYHHLSDNRDATATLKFTGVAVYFMGPLWSYHVGVNAAVDDAPPSFVDLQNHGIPETVGGPETDTSAVRWGVSGLENVEHTFVVSWPTGTETQWMITDAFIFTEDDGIEDESSSSSSTTSSSTFHQTFSSTPTSTSKETLADPTTAATDSNSSSTGMNIALIVGPVAGGIAVVAGLLLLFFCCCRRRRHGRAFDIDGDGWAEPDEKRSHWSTILSRHAAKPQPEEDLSGPHLVMEPFQVQPVATPSKSEPRWNSYASHSTYTDQPSLYGPHATSTVTSRTTASSSTSSPSAPARTKKNSGYTLANQDEPPVNREVLIEEDGDELPPSYQSSGFRRASSSQFPMDRKH